MKIPIEYGEWHCSVNNLNSVTFRRFQHVSLHNPIKNIEFRLEKKRFDKKKDKDIFFRNFDRYQLPLLQTRALRKEYPNKQNQASQANIEQKNTKLKSIEKESVSAKSKRRQLSRYAIGQSQKIACIPRFKNNNFNRLTTKGQGQIYFSYTYNIAKQIQKATQDDEKINILATDMELLIANIDTNQSILTTIKNIELFKKKTMYFNFHYAQVRILFHVLLAQLQLYQNNLQNSITEFQFCEYYCRKENLYTLIMCFLWQISRINMNLLKYQEADLNLRDLLQMAIVCKNNNIIKYLLQQISVLYYYRGNSIMGHYYLKKSEQGLSSFQTDIILKQYCKEDQLKRLQKKLFNEPHESVRQKRKNNKKFQIDIWRSQKQNFGLIKNQYMQVVNKMMKDHEHAKIGRQIKKIAYNLNNQGMFFKESENQQNSSFKNTIRASFDQNTKENQNFNDTKRDSDKMRRSFQQSVKRRRVKYVRTTNQGVEQNVTNVIKSHLSQNRESTKANKEQRWRKLLSFLSNIESQVRQMKNSLNVDLTDTKNIIINTTNNQRGKEMSRFNTIKTIAESQRRIIL